MFSKGSLFTNHNKNTCRLLWAAGDTAGSLAGLKGSSGAKLAMRQAVPLRPPSPLVVLTQWAPKDMASSDGGQLKEYVYTTPRPGDDQTLCIRTLQGMQVPGGRNWGGEAANQRACDPGTIMQASPIPASQYGAKSARLKKIGRLTSFV